MTSLRLGVLAFGLSPALHDRCTPQPRPPISQQRPQNSILTTCAALSPERPRHFWLAPKTKTQLTRGLEAGIETHLIGPKEAHFLPEWERLAVFDAITVASDGTFPSGVVFRCHSADDVDAVILRGLDSNAGETIVVDTRGHVIAMENVIAAMQQDGFAARVFVVVRTASEAATMLNLLDVGVDGVVLASDSAEEISLFGARKRALLEASQDAFLVDAMAVATVRDVQSVGTGDRVCIDCCSGMEVDEFVLVGNSSLQMMGIMSEAAQNDYVSSRVFRFNAGPLHHYVLTPGGKTKYLSELESGSEILVCRMRDGCYSTRSVLVGRSKVERRPLLLIKAETEDGKMCTIFMQNAETCRVAKVEPDGSVSGQSVIGLAAGDRVLVRGDSKARHMGMAYVRSFPQKVSLTRNPARWYLTHIDLIHNFSSTGLLSKSRRSEVALRCQ